MNIKNKVTESVATAKRVVTNAEQFVQATALVILAGWSWYSLKKYGASGVTLWVVTGSIAVASIRAFLEYIKFFDKK